MRCLRRILLLLALMLWQGGFMFYAGVVVPIGSQVLGSDLAQGFITKEVTGAMHWFGLAALLIWAWEIWAEPRHRVPRQGVWLLLLILLLAQFALRASMNQLLDSEAFRVIDRSQFYTLHQTYLILTTLQWAAALLLLGWTVRTWTPQSPEQTSMAELSP